MLGPWMGSSKALQTKRYRAFLAQLRRARLDSGLTQVEIAKRLGKPQTWVSKCELGDRREDFVELEDGRPRAGSRWSGSAHVATRGLARRSFFVRVRRTPAQPSQPRTALRSLTTTEE